MTDKQYPDVDPEDLNEYYTRHISAMTGEKLHSKADIAAQLAWRDREIDALRAQIAEMGRWRCAATEFPKGGETVILDGPVYPVTGQYSHREDWWAFYSTAADRSSGECHGIRWLPIPSDSATRQPQPQAPTAQTHQPEDAAT